MTATNRRFPPPWSIRTNSKAAPGVTAAALPCPPYVPLNGIVRDVETGNEVAGFTISL